MHIHIRGKRFGVHLWAPLAIFKLRSVRERVFPNERKQMKKFLKIIKAYIKENGHFTLVDAQTESSIRIKVKI